MCIGMPLSHTLPSLICDIDTVVVDGQLVGQEGESSASSRGFDSQTSNGLTPVSYTHLTLPTIYSV